MHMQFFAHSNFKSSIDNKLTFIYCLGYSIIKYCEGLRAMTSSSSSKKSSKKAITLTGVSSQEEKWARKIVSECFPVEVYCFEAALSRATHVLVVKKVGSDKYRAAVENRIPMVTLKWLEDCAAAKDYMDFQNCVDSKQVDPKYVVHPLLGLSLSLTGFEPPERERFKHMIESNGGTINTGLSKESTHLIATFSLHHNNGTDDGGAMPLTGNAVRNSSAFKSFQRKYEAALQWNIKIVRKEWLVDCVLLKRCVPESDYPVPSPADIIADIAPTEATMEEDNNAVLDAAAVVTDEADGEAVSPRDGEDNDMDVNNESTVATTTMDNTTNNGIKKASSDADQCLKEIRKLAAELVQNRVSLARPVFSRQTFFINGFGSEVAP
jgi:flagellin-like hook-associated protein FlgL